MHNPCHPVTEKKGERAPLRHVLLQPVEKWQEKERSENKQRKNLC